MPVTGGEVLSRMHGIDLDIFRVESLTLPRFLQHGQQDKEAIPNQVRDQMNIESNIDILLAGMIYKLFELPRKRMLRMQ